MTGSRFAVGDKVICAIEHSGDPGPCTWYDGMNRHVGQCMTVSLVATNGDTGHCVCVIENDWVWDEKWLLPAGGEGRAPTEAGRFKEGDKVVPLHSHEGEPLWVPPMEKTVGVVSVVRSCSDGGNHVRLENGFIYLSEWLVHAPSEARMFNVGDRVTCPFVPQLGGCGPTFVPHMKTLIGREGRVTQKIVVEGVACYTVQILGGLPFNYRTSWLSPLSSDQDEGPRRFEVGDRVTCPRIPDDLSFNPGPGWADDMETLLGSVGVVVERVGTGNFVVVDYGDESPVGCCQFSYLPHWLTLAETGSAETPAKQAPKDVKKLLQGALSDANDALIELLDLCPGLRDDRMQALMEIIDEALTEAKTGA